MEETHSSAVLLAQSKPASTAQQQKWQNEIEPVMDSFVNASLRRQRGGNTCCRVAGNQFFANPADLGSESQLLNLGSLLIKKVSFIGGDKVYCCPRCCPEPVPPSKCFNACNPRLTEFLNNMEPITTASRAH
jgi:hypothetical protein